jgi:hypothetical protein
VSFLGELCKRIHGPQETVRNLSFCQIPKVLLFPLPPWANLSHSAPSLPWLWKIARTIIKTYSESSFSGGSNDTIREVSATRKLLANAFTSSNSDCSAQIRSRELKLVSLKPPENEDSEYFVKIVLTCL